MEMFLELDDVIAKTEKLALDSTTYISHFTNGTIAAYYQYVIEQLAIDLMAIPVDREIKKLSPIDNPQEVAAAVEQTTLIVSRVFGKPNSDVQSDLNKCVSSLALADVREARRMRCEGLLN